MRHARPLLLGGFALLVALASGCSDDEPDHAHLDDAHDEHEWSYADVDAWGDTCATGEQQSPIDLAGADEADLVDLELDYRSSSATVADTGHSVQTTVEDGGTMTRDGETYTLRQFHVHTPSEHLVAGAPYAAELHLVHESEDGELAVLGVLVEEGPAHPILADVLAHVPGAGADASPTTRPVDVAALLPTDLRTFRYDGSLTTPPCSEGVAWSVLREPVTWSAGQLEAFAALHPGSHRPPQPLGDRVLQLDLD